MEGNGEQETGNSKENQLPTHDSLLPCIDSSNECVNELTEKAIAPHNSSLPCLDSSNECVNELTNRAIVHSSKLQKLSERITIIDERLKVTEERIDYTKKKRWTNYISTNPVDIIQNLFGGGDVQRDRLAIADLEIKTADLLAAKAELERQQEEEKVRVGDKVLRLLLDYEAASRRHRLLSSQLETLEQQREVTRIAYKRDKNHPYIRATDEETDAAVEQLISGLRGRRLTQFGGLFREIHKELNLEDTTYSYSNCC